MQGVPELLDSVKPISLVETLIAPATETFLKTAGLYICGVQQSTRSHRWLQYLQVRRRQYTHERQSDEFDCAPLKITQI